MIKSHTFRYKLNIMLFTRVDYLEVMILSMLMFTLIKDSLLAYLDMNLVLRVFMLLGSLQMDALESQYHQLQLHL